MRALDLDGRTFGQLTVICNVRGHGGGRRPCRCACGAEIVVATNKLTLHGQRSCKACMAPPAGRPKGLRNSADSAEDYVRRELLDGPASITELAFVLEMRRDTVRKAVKRMKAAQAVGARYSRSTGSGPREHVYALRQAEGKS